VGVATRPPAIPFLPSLPPHVLAFTAGAALVLLGGVDVELVRHLPDKVDIALVVGGASLIAGVAVPSPW